MTSMLTAKTPSDWLKVADDLALRIAEAKIKRDEAAQKGYQFLVDACDELIAALSHNEDQALRFCIRDDIS